MADAKEYFQKIELNPPSSLLAMARQNCDGHRDGQMDI